MTALCWLYWCACQLAALAFYWWPWHWHAWVRLPIGLTVAVALCLFKAWGSPPSLSIKPLPNRSYIDNWPRAFNWLWGNPEDGASGMCAYGSSWSGAFNPRGSRWRAILWNLRNWLAGFNYLTWRGAGTPPLLALGPVKLGWQVRYGRTVMVCGL